MKILFSKFKNIKSELKIKFYLKYYFKNTKIYYSFQVLYFYRKKIIYIQNHIFCELNFKLNSKKILYEKLIGIKEKWYWMNESFNNFN